MLESPVIHHQLKPAILLGQTLPSAAPRHTIVSECECERQVLCKYLTVRHPLAQAPP